MRQLILCLLAYLFAVQPVSAVLTIEITGGQEEGGGQPIAIVPFGQEAGATLREDIAAIISNDLYRTGKFAPIPAANLPATPFQANQVDFPTWQSAAIPHIVIGRVAGNAVTGYTIEFELFDIFGTHRMIGLAYKANNKTVRHVAHKISDAIYHALTGEKGVFSTRIVYVTVKRGGNSSIYRLYIADADGSNPQLMLESREPIFSPSWSPDGQNIAYVSMENKQVAVYLQEVVTGKRNRVAAWPGLNSAPAWSPDGSRLALTLSKDGNPEIYTMDLKTHQLTRLTFDPAIDTEPSWSPDGQSIAFTSDRTGKPQIYRISANGSNTQRLTFEGNYNTTARFSPDGRKLVFLRGGTGYRISTLDLDNGQVSVLSQTSSDKSPSFAPNGSMILYSSGRSLAATSADGRVHQRISTGTDEEVREPAWSPFTD